MATPRYAERLRVPAAWWVVGAAFAVTVGWVCFIATPLPVALTATALAAAATGVALARYGSPAVVVDDRGLTAGRAHLPWAYVGPAVALDAEQSRRTAGAEADARAYLLLRPYCTETVKVAVDDDADPTPYWLISSRLPGELARQLSTRPGQDRMQD